MPLWNATMVAMAPKDTGARLSSPAYPVSTVSESAMIANERPRMRVPTLESSIS